VVREEGKEADKGQKRMIGEGRREGVGR